MIEQEWMQFESTGHVADYLAYSRGRGAECSVNCSGGCGQGYDTDCDVREREARNGADHCAYRYGIGSNTHR